MPARLPARPPTEAVTFMKRDAIDSSSPDSSLDPTGADERQQLYDRMRPAGLTPLWEVLHALVPQQPAVRSRPAHWRWTVSG